jgi:tetratricopeptide (TPR) repeat protein
MHSSGKYRQAFDMLTEAILACDQTPAHQEAQAPQPIDSIYIDDSETAEQPAQPPNPTNVPVLLKSACLCQRAAANMKLKDFDSALRDSEHAAKLTPNNAKAHCSMGEALMAIERYKEAREELEKSIELDPSFLLPRMQIRKCRTAETNGK